MSATSSDSLRTRFDETVEVDGDTYEKASSSRNLQIATTSPDHRQAYWDDLEDSVRRPLMDIGALPPSPRPGHWPKVFIRRMPNFYAFITSILIVIIFVLSILIAYGKGNHIPDSLKSIPKLPTSMCHQEASSPLSSASGGGDKKLGLWNASSLPSGAPHARSCLCPATETGQRLCQTYPPAALKRSRLYSGTNARFKKIITSFLNDRRRGDKRPLKLGIMGGSISACHGVSKDDMLGKQCYGRIVGDWLRDRMAEELGEDPEGVVEVRNGAIGGMDSSYYAFCGTHHLSYDVDIVILEFDVNDQPDRDFAVYFDQLMRVVLTFPRAPAVLILGSWGPLIAHDLGGLTPMWPHLPSALYYDVPYVSLLPMIYTTYLRFPASIYSRFFLPDGFHPSAAGHGLLADVTISYLEGVLCELDRDKAEALQGILEWPETESWIGGGPHVGDKAPNFSSLVSIVKTAPTADGLAPEVTSYGLLSLPNTTSLPPVPLPNPASFYTDPKDLDPVSWNHLWTEKNRKPKPFCADANDVINPLKPKENTGWEPMVWKDEKHYWISDKVGAAMKVDIVVNEGRVAVYYFRSQKLSPGVADCWVDDNRRGAVRLEGYWDKAINVPSVTYIDAEVTAGKHFVTCEISPDSHDPASPIAHHFRIVAIMAT